MGSQLKAKANFERAKEQYPSTEMGEGQWVAAFDRNPDIMWAILGDIYQVVRDEEERDNGTRRMGRRPVRAAGSVDELMRTVLPDQYTQEPFKGALAKLLKGRSQQAFANKIPCSQSTMSRLLSGDAEPDMAMMERVAAAAKVQPHYFLEYRARYVSDMVQQVLTERPNVSITAFRKARGGLK